MENRKTTFSVYTENSPGSLQRITTAFTKRKLNIDSLTVSETSEPGLSLLTIVASTDLQTETTIVKQLERVIEVQKVFATPDNAALLSVEAALLRVAARSQAEREQIISSCRPESVKLVHEDEISVVFEFVGTESEIEQLKASLADHEILQFVRTGRIALRKKFVSIHQ